ncbi:S9 family peptidase [Levilactobacillus tangyuanensis]|uniref:S9 family peptidase n=1 Tax=Levilactobacillus tangyuanensis TaxID=2486021 RepID=A0ABW1TPU8_9LACO|nr:S9 family peptidase [Levilactobacillus tangyuanensis]
MSQGVSAEDLFKLKALSQPVAANDHIYYVENGVDQVSNGYTATIKAVDALGAVQTIGTNGTLNLQPATVGDDVYYTATVGQAKPQLYRVSKGQEPECLTKNANEAVNTVIAAASGQTVYFKTTETAEQPKLPSPQDFPATRHVTRLINKADGYGWLPQDVTYRLRRFTPATGMVEQLFAQGYDFDLTSVSADGQAVTYISDEQPLNDRNFNRAVNYLDVTTGETVSLTGSLKQGRFTDATISPDGRHVALVGDDGAFGRHTVADLFMADTISGDLERLTGDLDADLVPDFAGDFEQHASGKLVRWLDANHYVFTAAYHGRSQLYSGQINGQPKLLNDDARQIIDFAVMDAQTLALVVSYQDLPSELVRFSLTVGAEEPLVNPNAAYESTHEYAHPHRFDFQATDGQQLEGWYLPARTTAPKQPVLLYVHGGPHANYGETFFYEFQVHASRGFGVVFFNPRGSTSYGQAFENNVIGHYGADDYQDVITGLDAALAKYPRLDATRQYIAGGSYGGFMTLWAIGHTTRFAAAIAQRPVTNWISLFGTSDIGFYFEPEELDADLFSKEGLASYWQQSPLAYAEQVTTPVRLLHGEWDMRCPIGQSEEYFTAIKRNGVEADFIRYPQSFHGVSRDGLPSLRVQRIDDMTAWFVAHPSARN